MPPLGPFMFRQDGPALAVPAGAGPVVLAAVVGLLLMALVLVAWTNAGVATPTGKTTTTGTTTTTTVGPNSR